VETEWKGWTTHERILLGRVRNWIEMRFSVMVRSLDLHRIATFPSGKHLVARSFWGMAARANLILLVHNLFLASCPRVLNATHPFPLGCRSEWKKPTETGRLLPVDWLTNPEIWLAFLTLTVLEGHGGPHPQGVRLLRHGLRSLRGVAEPEGGV